MKDRLPEEDQDVLLYCAAWQAVGYWSNIGGGEWVWFANDRTYEPGTVSHWMPLPEPPQETGP